MNARIVTGAVCAAGFALVIVTMPRERAPERAPAPTTARRARPPRPQARPARQPAASPSTKPPEAVTALPVALDAGAAANDRASALDSIDPAALGEGDVRRLALLASTPGLDEDVRAAALSLLLAVAEDGSRAARLRALAFFLGEAPDESTEPRLGALLADGDAEVRKGAADALGSASPASRDAALLALERAFPAETDDGVQEAMAA
ncbi:HEAT repeat domain-containing protein, partial [bacterium]|nr:HEAT repeat domain-containing protein [bacterium]